ncbi:MAG TPA: head-tail connector protein, partial [Devosia sp.]|nr:head-tail connector protein [Devosia sp.]
ALIAAARLQVEGSTGRALVTQSWRLALDRPAGRLVPLPAVPVATLVAVTVDGQSVDAALQGDCVLLPAPATQSLSIDYTAGYGDAAAVPADLQQAVLVLIAYWFENRDAAAPAQLPSGFDRLLATYRRVQL